MSWDIPGQARAAAILRGAVGRGEVSHAWAFVGPAGVGQEQAARTLAAALNCRAADRDASDPCGRCGDCRRSLRGAHPAYAEFAPVGPMHRVNEVRDEWLRAAFQTVAAGSWKVLRIVDADRMNEAAANAFLKGLEEPPPATVWVLDVTDPEELPDTILSRCRSVRFVPWGPGELDAEARRLGLTRPDDRDLAVRASLGEPARLGRLAAEGGLDDLRAHRAIPGRLRADGPGHAVVAARFLEEEIKRRTATLKAQAGEERDRLADLYGGEPPRSVVRQVGDRLARQEREVRVAVLAGALDDLVAWYRDCLLVAAGGDPADAVNADAPDELRADAAALGPTALLAATDRCLAVRDDLVELNLQQALTLEALFLELSALALEVGRSAR